MKRKQKEEKIFISLPSQAEPIEIGPSAVPNSPGSVSTVSIEDLIKSAREVSKLGIYDTDNRGVPTQD